MDNPGRLFGQIAAESGVSSHRAKVALYLFGLSKQGRSADYAATAMKYSVETIKDYAREFLIDFSDYRPFGKRRDAGEVIEPRTPISNFAAYL